MLTYVPVISIFSEIRKTKQKTRDAVSLLTENFPPSLEPHQQTAQPSSVRDPDKQLRKLCVNSWTHTTEIPIEERIAYTHKKKRWVKQFRLRQNSTEWKRKRSILGPGGYSDSLSWTNQLDSNLATASSSWITSAGFLLAFLPFTFLLEYNETFAYSFICCSSMLTVLTVVSPRRCEVFCHSSGSVVPLVKAYVVERCKWEDATILMQHIAGQ